MFQRDLLMGVLASAIMLLMWRRPDRIGVVPLVVLAGAAALALYGVVAVRPLITTRPLGPLPFVLAAGQLAVLALAWTARGRPHLRDWTILASIVLVVGGGTYTLLMTPSPTIDVAQLHVDAGRVLRAGGNPYSDVRVMANGTPEFKPFLIDGYTYPPAALAAFGGSAALTGDGRWAGLIALGAGVAGLGLRVRKGDSWPALAVFAAVASQPGLPLVLEAAWTETLTVGLLLWALLLWNRRPVAAAILLGSALASKQYLVLLAPLALSPVFAGRRRWILAGGVVTTLPAALIDVRAFVDHVIRFHLEIGDLTTTGTVGAILAQLGVGWRVPALAAAVIATGAGFALARRAVSWDRLLLAAATVLAIAFSLGSQAYPNYWMLLTFLIASSVVFTAGPARP